MRSDDELLEIFRSAFLPLSCEARVGDYGKQIVFRILGRDGKLVREGRYPLTHIRTDMELEIHIRNARDQVAAKTVVQFDSWMLPRARK
jgi:hypothetical protein